MNSRQLDGVVDVRDESDRDGMRVVVDCANGAAYKAAPAAFWELGAEVITIGNLPNGLNINDGCGETHPERLREEVLRHRADAGEPLGAYKSEEKGAAVVAESSGVDSAAAAYDDAFDAFCEEDPSADECKVFD